MIIDTVHAISEKVPWLPLPPSRWKHRRCNLPNTSFRSQEIKLRRGISCILNLDPNPKRMNISLRLRRNRKHRRAETEYQNLYTQHVSFSCKKEMNGGYYLASAKLAKTTPTHPAEPQTAPLR